MPANPSRGQIWLVDWSPGRGSEQLGTRPALVIQTDAANANPRYPNTIVLAISRTGHPVASHVKIEPNSANGLRETSYVKCEQVLTISKTRLIQFFGSISEDDLRAVEAALSRILVL
jgi:mRNA interferase MazF